MNSRTKGKVGEREFAALLRENGFDARRGQQFSGSPDSPDVVSESLAWLHVEVKRVEHLNLTDACAQAKRDASGKPWIVAHRKNRGPWFVTMDSEFFFDLIREFQPQMNTDEHGFCQPQENAKGAEVLTANDANYAKGIGAHGVTRPTTKTISSRHVAGSEQQQQSNNQVTKEQTV